MDIVEISRIRSIVKQPIAERFLFRVLTPHERKLADERQGRLHEFVAGRFAAKEAVVKALGCGIGHKAGFQDIEVIPDPFGKPLCTLSDTARRRLGIERDCIIHLSITHTSTLAAAYAIIERGKSLF